MPEFWTFCQVKKRHIGIAVLLIGILCGAVWWHFTRHGVLAEALLKRANLAGTSVTYSWTGGFGAGDVRARFLGSGSADLKVAGNQQVQAKITEARYRELLQSLAANKFDQIRVQRRWGAYVYDIGRYEIVLADGFRRTVVYADEKHYVDHPERLLPVMQQIYSFQKEFGQQFDHGPLATTTTGDVTDLVALAALASCVLVGLLVVSFRRRRKKSRAEQDAAPNAGSAGAPPASVS